MGLEEHNKKLSYFRNGADIKPTGDVIPEGMKRVWIPKHRFWVEVPIDEPDEEAIKRVTKKHDNAIKFKIEDGKDKSKDL